MTEPLAMKPRQAAEALGISLSQVYSLMKEGKLKATHLSSRLTLIPIESIKAMLGAA